MPKTVSVLSTVLKKNWQIRIGRCQIGEYEKYKNGNLNNKNNSVDSLVTNLWLKNSFKTFSMSVEN